VRVHPVAALFPELDGEALAELAADIKANGLIHAILVDEHDVLLDGRNRLKACKLAGVEPRFTVWRGGSIVARVISENLKRRHLTKTQQAALAVELKPLLAAEAAQRMRAGKASDPTPKVEEGRKRAALANEAAAQAGKLAGGVGRTYVLQAEKVRAASPATFERLKAGSLTLADARKEVVREHRQRTEAEAPWPKAERELREALERGEVAVINVDKHAHLTSWAERRGLLVMVDRSSPWGNPFVLGDDGTRDAVCEAYAKHYLPHKPSLLKKLPALRGKALGCHCAPLRCHGDTIAKAVSRGA
jgi:ParB-like chromosome segregation protein Spo0J